MEPWIPGCVGACWRIGAAYLGNGKLANRAFLFKLRLALQGCSPACLQDCNVVLLPLCLQARGCCRT